MRSYDVVVVGAGPIGSTFARHAAEKGLNVAIFEKKKEIGVPLQCAGLVCRNIEDINLLPHEFILNKIYGAYLYSPSGNVLSVKKKEPVAYVIDRVAYDRFLARSAADSGAKIFLNHTVNNVDIESGALILKGERISAEVIVGADGYSSIVSNLFNPPTMFMRASQFLVDMGKNILDTDYVHLHVNSRISPGFLWIIPLSESIARIGLFADGDYNDLNRILKEFLITDQKFKDASILKKYRGVIPLYDPKKKILKDRAILIGDAASQVKPTTGGGLITGLTCAKIASEIVSSAIESGDMDILKNYEIEFRQIFEEELKMQLKIQSVFKRLNNDDLDFMFLKLKEEGAEEIISEHGDMNFQSPLIKEMIKNRMIFSVIPTVLARRISNSWKFY